MLILSLSDALLFFGGELFLGSDISFSLVSDFGASIVAFDVIEIGSFKSIILH